MLAAAARFQVAGVFACLEPGDKPRSVVRVEYWVFAGCFLAAPPAWVAEDVPAFATRLIRGKQTVRQTAVATARSSAAVTHTFGVQNVRLAMPTLDMTRASVPTAVPISRKSVRLNDIDVVIPAGNDVGHFAEPSGALAQQEPETLSFLGSHCWYGQRLTPCNASLHQL